MMSFGDREGNNLGSWNESLIFCKDGPTPHIEWNFSKQQQKQMKPIHLDSWVIRKSFIDDSVLCVGRHWFFDEAIKSGCESHSVVCDSLLSHGLYSPWNSPGQNTGGGTLSILQGSSQPRDWTQVSSIAGGFVISWATREAQEYQSA